MEKTLNQKIYEVPLDIKQAIYDRGYEAGRQSVLEQEEAKWIPAESSRYGSMYAGAKCSNCGGGVDGYVSIHFKFCPFCGKRMEEYKPYTAVATGDKTASADDTSIAYVGNREVDDIQIYGYRVEED